MLAVGICFGAEDSGQVVDEVLPRKGHNAVGGPGDVIELEVEVLGPLCPGFLGGKGTRSPVAHHQVIFSLVSDGSGALLLDPTTTLTDAGGRARCCIRLGSKFGDYYVEARTVSADGIPCTALFRVTSGLKLFGDGQESAAGATLDKPLAVQVLDPSGNPVSGVPVFFSIDGRAEGALLTPERTMTGTDGIASSFLKLPPTTGKVHVTAEVADPERGYVARGIRFSAASLNKTLMLVTLLGGLAMFVFGMKLMSEGLQRVAGEKLKWILKMFTKNRIIAIAVGTLVTALIQSSSACTVMTVGFVNAGLVTLRQAIGVILGADIGTTVTGQIISLKLTDLAYPAITVGLIVIMVVRNRTHKFWGQAIMGFGLLFLGMSVMSGTLRPLRDCPSFVRFFQGFDCTPVNGLMPLRSVLYGIFMGTAMTMVIQSSSATVGLTMALAGGGLINFYTAVPIILGDNIGTTITAILASIGTNRAARRTALAHALVKVFGATYMVIMFYVPAFWSESGRPIFVQLVQDITKGNVFADAPENIERHIAMAHTTFNILNVALFLPFVAPLERLCNTIIPRVKEEEKLKYLEPRLLNQPSIALEQAIRELGHMSSMSFEAITDSFASLDNLDARLEEKLQKREDAIDRLQADITEYLVGLSQHHLSEQESRMLAPLMHAVNDVERIGDHAENILELAQLKKARKLTFSESAHAQLRNMFGAVRQQFEDVMGAIQKRDPSLADSALKLEETINQLDRELHNGHVRRLEAAECSTQAGVIFLDLVANFEKVGDHLTNVAERIRLVINLGKQEVYAQSQ